jgi:hypothetical protein
MMIWEGYYHPGKTEVWIEAFEKLRHINAHVVQDIEDYIMLDAFKGKSRDQIRNLIETDLANRKKKKGKSKEEEEEEKLEDKRRRFLQQMRPPYVWNFFEEGDHTPHILRAEAEPHKCYVDGRVESLFADIQSLAAHITKHQEERWKLLVKYTVEIFKAEHKQDLERAAEEEKAAQAAPAKK